MANPVRLAHGFIYDDNIYSVRVAGELETFRYVLFVPLYDVGEDTDDGLIMWNLMPIATPAQQLLFAPQTVPFPTTNEQDQTTIYQLRAYWLRWLNEHAENWAISEQGPDTYAPPQLYFEHLEELTSFVDECSRHLDLLKLPEKVT